jgi:hypothetical protein
MWMITTVFKRTVPDEWKEIGSPSDGRDIDPVPYTGESELFAPKTMKRQSRNSKMLAETSDLRKSSTGSFLVLESTKTSHSTISIQHGWETTCFTSWKWKNGNQCNSILRRDCHHRWSRRTVQWMSHGSNASWVPFCWLHMVHSRISRNQLPQACQKMHTVTFTEWCTLPTIGSCTIILRAGTLSSEMCSTSHHQTSQGIIANQSTWRTRSTRDGNSAWFL